MDLTSIISFVTFIVTYIFGELSKKFDWVESKYIPIQNFIIGAIASVIYYFFVDNSNLEHAIIVVISALSAAGMYDLTKINKKGE